jgi:hypothetical protein
MRFEKELSEGSVIARCRGPREEDASRPLDATPRSLAGSELPSVDHGGPRSAAAALYSWIMADFAQYGACMYAPYWPSARLDPDSDTSRGGWLEPEHQTSIFALPRRPSKSQRRSRQMRCIERPRQRVYVIDHDVDLYGSTPIDPTKTSAPPWGASILSMLAKSWLALRRAAAVRKSKRS